MIKLNPIQISQAAQIYAVELTERLCRPFCENASIQPVVNAKFIAEDVRIVQGVEYIKIKVQGSVTYVPQNGSPCCPCTKIFTEYFTVAFEDVSELKNPTIEVEEGYVEPAFVNCYGIACGISGVGRLTIKIPA